MSQEDPASPPSSTDPAEEKRRAMDAALSFLSYRPRTRQEVRRKLAEKEFSEELVEYALSRLGAVGLIDDEAFVGTYVRDRIRNRPMGIRRLAEELYSKGVVRDVALPVIERVFADECVDERALALRAAEKKARSLREGADGRVVRRRLYGHLARRGFNPGTIREAIDACVPEGGANA